MEVQDKPERSIKYCFGCLSDSVDKHNIQSYKFACGSLKEIFQMGSIHLCSICRRMARHTELFIQNVQSNQILLDNYCNAMEETFKSVQSQSQPLVNLSQYTQEVMELSDKEGSGVEECFTVVSSKKVDFNIKLEMKEETELLDNIEAEFINGDDEFPDMFDDVKEEDDYPLTEMLKEELDTDNKELMNISSTLKKKVKKKGNKMKHEDVNTNNRDVPKVKLIYQTKKQCLEERARLALDHKYLASAYKCAHCVKGFSFKGSYDEHMEKHNRSMGEYQCDICKQRMDSAEKLVNHMRYHLIRYRCVECGLTRNCRMTIKDHYAAHHVVADHQFPCSLCHKTFKRQLNLRKHMRYAHVANERVQCAYCERMYANKAVLKAHMMHKHAAAVGGAAAGEGAGRRWSCSECGAQFRSASHLRSHALKHSAAREYYCVECDKSFKSESILKTHLRTASVHVNYQELPLSCMHCEKRFSNRRDVERHTNRIHLNIKPYECDKCDKAYVNAWALKDHKRYVHEGYKRPLQFPCPMCDKIFDRNQILKSHVRTHTGERPYVCGKCGAQFAQRGVLRTHDRLVHLKLTRDGRPKALHHKQ